LRQVLTALAKEILPARVRELAARCGVSVGTISIRNQQSRWGSCTTHGNLSLNWRLVLLPPAMRDHVLLHELAHRRHMNHSDDFWDLLCAWDPQAVRHDAELRKLWSKVFYFR
jgi:predicted metal-dependent hydrolase